MSTKRNPSPNDCYVKADIDEPIFTFRAKDTLAPVMVRLWCLFRQGIFGGEGFNDLIRDARDANLNKKPIVINKLMEALHCASDMERWKPKTKFQLQFNGEFIGEPRDSIAEVSQDLPNTVRVIQNMDASVTFDLPKGYSIHAL